MVGLSHCGKEDNGVANVKIAVNNQSGRYCCLSAVVRLRTEICTSEMSTPDRASDHGKARGHNP